MCVCVDKITIHPNLSVVSVGEKHIKHLVQAPEANLGFFSKKMFLSLTLRDTLKATFEGWFQRVCTRVSVDEN